MSILCLAEPLFSPNSQYGDERETEICLPCFISEEFCMPLLGDKTFLKILKNPKCKKENFVIDMVYKEHQAIYDALREMGLDPSILMKTPGYFDKGLLQSYQDKQAKFLYLPSELFLAPTSYPRDMIVHLRGKNIFLADGERFCELQKKEVPWKIVNSIYGEGGRVLTCDDLAIFYQTCIDTKSEYVVGSTHDEFKKLASLGMRVLILPNQLTKHAKRNGKTKDPQGRIKTAIDDHIDRSCALVKDRDGNKHLIVSAYMSTYYDGRKLNPRQSIQLIRELVKPFGIHLHFLSKVCVPFAINLF